MLNTATRARRAFFSLCGPGSGVYNLYLRTILSGVYNLYLRTILFNMEQK